jgi:enterochelin esterase-like enzyme
VEPSRLGTALVTLAAVMSSPPPPARAQAQPPAPAAPAAQPAQPALQSPEVLPDRRVTLRLHAPRAAEVTVAGEWTRPDGAPNAPQKLARDAQGTWSITVGPLAPNIYIYVFNVDGMVITDPVNPLVKLRARTSASMVEVPGQQPWEPRDVPHGALHTHTHQSALLGGATRQVVVYTPPGYDGNRAARFPVVYLLHGNNDLAVGWTMAGRAHLILDNLIADRKAVPMVVVMPWGHALPFGSKPPAGQPGNNDLFQRYLLDEVVPLVEGRYRIAAGRRNRAIVGLSMGGTQATQIALTHPDRFGSLGIFGAGMTRADFEARHAQALAALAAGKTRPRFDLVFVGAGKLDGVLPRARALSEALRAHGLPTTYEETEGGHTYPTWRELFVKAAPLLFRSGKS